MRVRQELDSGILVNATEIRKIQDGFYEAMKHDMLGLDDKTHGWSKLMDAINKAILVIKSKIACLLFDRTNEPTYTIRIFEVAFFCKKMN